MEFGVNSKKHREYMCTDYEEPQERTKMWIQQQVF